MAFLDLRGSWHCTFCLRPSCAPPGSVSDIPLDMQPIARSQTCRNFLSSRSADHPAGWRQRRHMPVVQARACTARNDGAADVEPAAPAVSRAALLRSALAAAGSTVLAQPQPSLAMDEASVSAELAAAAATAVAEAPKTISSVMLNTLSDCQLAVSVYPTFVYNAAGGGGAGRAVRGPDGLLHVEFDAEQLNIPAIDAAHASIYGIPLPPPLRIDIRPQKLSGTIDPETGEINLDFLAKFDFSAGLLYRAPSLIVGTTLTTEQSDGPLRHGIGKRLSADGHARLAGVARVPRTGDGFLDGFLMLPTDALAVLSAELIFA